MRKILPLILAAIFCAGPVAALAQEYVAPEVRLSKDKVRVGGKVYWSHVVTPKQTLWSICKAYNVEVQDVYEANPSLNLRTEGLKANQILLIPVRKAKAQAKGTTDKALFPGVHIHTPAEEEEEKAGPEVPDSMPAPPDTLEAAPTDSADTFVADIPKRINVALLLPLGNGIAGNEGSMEFYSGVLLAARELGRNGIGIDLTLANVSDSAELASAPIADADVILGPVSEKDIRKALHRTSPHSRVISPLDPRVAAAAASDRIVQAPTPWQEQVRDLVSWASSEVQPADSIVLVKENDVPLSEDSAYLIEELRRSGLRFRTISYGILQGLNMQASFEAASTRDGVTRFFIASDNEAFVGDVIRNANLLAYKNYQVTVYSTSKVRSFDLIDVETFHNVSMRLATTYFVDYTDPAVKAFVLAYRALFKAEPGAYAFQGYDTAMYFISACSTWGRQWFKKLGDFPRRGLQTDFRFGRSDGPGQVNTAVRRVIYGTDYSISLL